MRGLLLLVLLPGVGLAQNVGRVVSVEGATVTLQVVTGSIVNGDTVEVFTPKGKSSGKVVTPSGIDLMLKGDTIKGVKLEGAKVEVGAVTGSKGQFGGWAQASAAAGTASPAPSSPQAAPPQKASPVGCVFSAAEVQAALGFKVKAGAGTEFLFSAGASYSCQYLPDDEKERRSLVVNRIVMTAGDPASNTRELRKRLAGTLEVIAGDADQAGWQVSQGDLTDVTLHYVRGNTSTELRVAGVNQRDAAAVAAMRKRVLALRRVE